MPSAFHNLSVTNNPYGAVIIAHSSLNCSLLPGASNNIVSIRLPDTTAPLSFTRIYSRPSVEHSVRLWSIQSRRNQLSRAVVCFHANAKNELWNNSFTEKTDSDIENILSLLPLSVVNIGTDDLHHVPSNTSFIDVTAAGDQIKIRDWFYLPIPLFSDHPQIFFPVPTAEPKSPNHFFPNPELCTIELFHELLTKDTEKLTPSDKMY